MIKNKTMALFHVGKDFETLERAGMAGWFQVDTLLNEEENDIFDQIDAGQHFENDEDLIKCLSKIFNISEDDIHLEEL